MKPASIAPGPTLAKPTTATGDPGDAPASRDPPAPGGTRRFTGTRRRASFGEWSLTSTTATSSGPRDTYTGAASFSHAFVPPGMPTRIDRTMGPLPSPPAAVDEGCTTCAFVSTSARPPTPPTPPIPPPPSSPSPPPPWTPMTTPDAHDAPPSVSNTTTDPRTTASNGFDAFRKEEEEAGPTRAPGDSPPGDSSPAENDDPLTSSRSASRMDAIVSTRGTVSCALVTPSRPRSSLTSGGVSTPITPPPSASRTGAPSVPGNATTSANSNGGSLPGDSPGDDSPGPSSSPPSRCRLPTRRPHARETCPPNTAHAKCVGDSAAKGDPHATIGEPSRTNPLLDPHPASLHSGGGEDDGAGPIVVARASFVSIRTTPVTAAPRGTCDASPSGATPPAVHPRRRAPSPVGPARASTAFDASLGTHDARTRARVHPPGSSPPSPSRPRRTWTSTPGARGDASGARARGRSSRASSRAARNGRKGASGAMKRSRSSPAAGRPSCRVDARVGIRSAVADIATTGAPSAPGRRSSSGR